MMSNMRYRKPSVSSLLGITRLKKRVKKALGINKLLWPFRAVNNYQRRMLRRAGYYSPELKMMRAVKRGQAPGPIGPLQVGEGEHESGKGLDSSALLMAAMLSQGTKQEEHHQKGGDGPNLAEAMLLATAMKSSEAAHAAPAKHAEAPAAKAKPARAAASAAHPRAARASSAKSKRRAAQPAPKTHRGLRIFGLVLVTLCVAAAIVAVWYYWII
jgi:hypothetical protein